MFRFLCILIVGSIEFYLLLILFAIETIVHGLTVNAIVSQTNGTVEHFDSLVHNAPTWTIDRFAVETVVEIFFRHRNTFVQISFVNIERNQIFDLSLLQSAVARIEIVAERASHGDFLVELDRSFQAIAWLN